MLLKLFVLFVYKEVMNNQALLRGKYWRLSSLGISGWEVVCRYANFTAKFAFLVIWPLAIANGQINFSTFIFQKNYLYLLLYYFLLFLFYYLFIFISLSTIFINNWLSLTIDQKIGSKPNNIIDFRRNLEVLQLESFFE